jgi:hypothetical protein
VTYPPSGQPPYYNGQPDQNQPQYGGYPQQPGYDGSAYPQQESYTTEPPMSGQPYSGQPYSGAPYSGPPFDQGYPQQPYDQGYAQPQQGAGYQNYAQPQQTPSFVAPPAQQQGGRGSMVALVVGIVALVVVALGIGGVLLVRAGDEDPADPVVAPSVTATPGPTGDPTPTPDEDAEYPATINLPQTVAGLTKVDNAELNKTANDTALQIKNDTNADSAVAGYYAPSGDMTKAVGLIGATGRITDPEGELDDAFAGEMAVSGVQDVDAGPLGGDMRCGNTANNGQALTVCGWADGGSLMLGIFANRSLTDSATLFRQIRGEILKRG